MLIKFLWKNVSFSKALANLKNTAIAKAINVTGQTFNAVIEELSSIVDNEGWNKTIDSPEKVMIPEGYHDGKGYIDASSLMVVPEETLVLTEPVEKTNCIDYAFVRTSGLMKIPTMNYDILENGRYNVTNYKSVVVNVSNNLKRLGTYDSSTTVYLKGAKTKAFYICNDINQHLGWSARPVWVNNWTGFEFNYVPPSISVENEYVNINLGYVQLYKVRGSITYDTGGDAPNDIFTYYLPVTVFYS